jgi:hypothetical protein
MDAKERKIETVAYKVIGNTLSGANHLGTNAVGCMQSLFGEAAAHHNFMRLLRKFTGNRLEKYFPSYYTGTTIHAVPDSAGIFVLDDIPSAMRFISNYDFYDITDIAQVICYGNKSTNIRTKFISGCFSVHNLCKAETPSDEWANNKSYSISAYQSIYVDHIIPKGEL